MATPLDSWDPLDPRGADPAAGQDGHFDHHAWLKEFALAANQEIATLRDRVTALEQAP
jgi:hypothetical protein